MAEKFCKVGFRFKPSHDEKHYLMNTKGRKYSTTWTTDPKKAVNVSIDKRDNAVEWVRSRLEKCSFGQENGYRFCGFVELGDGTTTTFIWCV